MQTSVDDSDSTRRRHDDVFPEVQGGQRASTPYVLVGAPQRALLSRNPQRSAASPTQRWRMAKWLPRKPSNHGRVSGYPRYTPTRAYLSRSPSRAMTSPTQGWRMAKWLPRKPSNHGRVSGYPQYIPTRTYGLARTRVEDCRGHWGLQSPSRGASPPSSLWEAFGQHPEGLLPSHMMVVATLRRVSQDLQAVLGTPRSCTQARRLDK